MISDFEGFQASAIVEKTSKTGLLSNKRVLAINSGVLYYYSNVPKDFKANDTEMLMNMKEAPKCSIEVRFLTGISQDPKKPSELTIKFAAYHAIEREEFKLRTSLVPTEELNLNTGKTNEIISWTFKFQTQQLARWWLISLEQLKAYFEKHNDDQNLERFLENFNADKKKANTARRQSEKLDTLLKGTGNSSNSGSQYRKSQLPQGLKGIAEEDEHQQQEEQISREVKLREDKLKREMEEKFKRELEARIAEENRQKELMLIEKELERQRVEAEKLAIIEEKERMLKKAEAELSAKLELELQMIRKMEEEKQKRLEEERERQAEAERQAEGQRKQRELQNQRRAQELEAKKKESALNNSKLRQIEKELKKPFESSLLTPSKETPPQRTQQSQSQPFRTYFEHFSSLFCENMQERLHHQTELMKFVVGCQLEAKALVRNIIDELELPSEQRRYHLVKNRFSTGKLSVELAFCSTASININGLSQVLYEERAFEVLERKLEISNLLNNRIMQVLKKRQFFPIRVPLTILLEYRGVGALVTLNDHIESGQPLQQSEEDLFQKELATLLPSANSDCFRTAAVDSSGQRLIVIELVQEMEGSNQSELSLHIPILPRDLVKINGNITVECVKATRRRIPRHQTHLEKEKLECLNYLEFCLNVRKLYRAGQGQLQDAELWRLVMNEDPSIVSMMEGDLCRTYSKRGLIIQYLREICGIEITLSPHWQPLDLKKIESAVPTVLAKEFTFEQLEVVELSDSIEKYIKEEKNRLVELALTYQKAIYTLEPEPHGAYILNQLSTHYRSKLYDACVKESQLLLSSLPATHTLKLRCYEILLGCYRHLQNHEMFMTTYKDTLQYVQFVLGETTYTIKLYCLLGQYLKSRGNAQEALGIYEEAVSLAKRLENKDEEVSLYIDMNNIHLESINAGDARNILSFSLVELEGKSERQDIIAKLQQHLAKLYHLVGQDQEALKRQVKATEFYEAQPQKHLLEVLEGYYLQLQLTSVQEEKQVAAKMTQLTVTTGDLQPLSKLIEFVFTRLIRKLSSKALTDLEQAVKLIQTEEPPSEEFVARLAKRTSANEKNVIEYLTNLYLNFLANFSDPLASKQFSQAVKLMGKDVLFRVISSSTSKP